MSLMAAPLLNLAPEKPPDTDPRRTGLTHPVADTPRGDLGSTGSAIWGAAVAAVISLPLWLVLAAVLMALRS
jgi:hypothetical protein